MQCSIVKVGLHKRAPKLTMKTRKTLSNNQISKKAKTTMFKQRNKKMSNKSKTTSLRVRTMRTQRLARKRSSTLPSLKSKSQKKSNSAHRRLALDSTTTTMLRMMCNPSKR